MPAILSFLGGGLLGAGAFVISYRALFGARATSDDLVDWLRGLEVEVEEPEERERWDLLGRETVAREVLQGIEERRRQREAARVRG
jgi:hypothetical protein